MSRYYDIYAIVFSVLLISSCNSVTSNQEDISPDHIIHLSEAVSKIRPVKLSEIADTIIFLPLKTGETTAVEGDGFIDDMSSIGTFYPQCGTLNKDLYKL
ncbi:MAG: hypothetical protein LBP25_03955 [Tannerellaceae bacterium]|jgi:hypothetical protein|nr:hypothetical protein [Tannerellaceae bacterium]